LSFFSGTEFLSRLKMFGLLRRSVCDIRIIAIQASRANRLVMNQRTMMKGPGGRHENNSVLPQGMTVKSLKHHYALIPLAVIMGLGMTFVVAFIFRLAIYSPDANWSRKTFDECSDYYKDRRMIFFNPRGIEMKSQAPDYKQE